MNSDIVLTILLSLRMKHPKEWARLQDHLAKHGLKVTKQREVILDTFLEKEHVTAEELYRTLNRHKPHIGLASLFRSLKLPCAFGIWPERPLRLQTQFD